MQRLREFAGEWPGRDALLRLSDSLMGPDEDIDRSIAFLADRFESGWIVAVRLRDDMPVGASPNAFAAIDWDNIPMLSELSAARDWAGDRVGDVDAPSRPAPGSILELLFNYEVRWVDEIGEPLAGVALTMDVGDARCACTTDADGVAKFQAPLVDGARVEVTDLPALREILRPRWEQVRAGDRLAERIDHTYVECADPRKPVAVKPEIRETIVVQPWVVRARLLELLFETNKAFLLPGALAHVRETVRLYQRREGSSLLIVDHTDATGEPDDNDLVSRARADSVRAFLCDDVDARLAWYGTDRSPASRWGEGEDLLMLQAGSRPYVDASFDPKWAASAIGTWKGDYRRLRKISATKHGLGADPESHLRRSCDRHGIVYFAEPPN